MPPTEIAGAIRLHAFGLPRTSEAICDGGGKGCLRLCHPVPAVAMMQTTQPRDTTYAFTPCRCSTMRRFGVSFASESCRRPSRKYLA